MSKKINPVSAGVDVQNTENTFAAENAADAEDENMPVIVTAITTDAYAGHGGSYTLDVTTGKRTRNE